MRKVLTVVLVPILMAAGVVLGMVDWEAVSHICAADEQLPRPRPANSSELGQGLHLIVEALDTFSAESFPEFTVTLENSTESTMRLVHPGDGSESHWRIPHVGWSVLSVDDTAERHPAETPTYLGGRCGNVNSLRCNETFALKAGEAIELTWISSPEFPGPGKYRVVFYYRSDPTRMVVPGGGAMGDDCPRAVRRMRASDPCALVSNEVIVVVTP